MSHVGDQSPEERIDRDTGTFDLRNDGVPLEERPSGTAGLPVQDDVPPETLEALERERAERLADHNRPDHTEIDNTRRTFDPAAGKFTDSSDYDRSDRPYATDEDA